jgi:hypothetical protein
VKTRKIVYTCITGGYDNIPRHPYVADGWDYVLFTDDAELIKRGRVEHWVVKPLAFNKLTNVKNARWHKVNAHKLFPDYDYSLWLDSNILVNNEKLFKIADDLIKKKTLVAVPNHPLRKCIYDEAVVIKNEQIDFPNIVDREINFLCEEGYPKNNGLSETGILLRAHNRIKKTLNLWWRMIAKYSKRDQLSFNYALWKTGVGATPIYTDVAGFGIHRTSSDFSFVYAPSHNHNNVAIDAGKQFIPKFIGRVFCCLIPIAKYRRRFRKTYVKDK